MDLKEDQIIGEDIWEHWYYKSKSRCLLNLLEGHNYQSILDVGAGSGYFSKVLLKETSVNQALCVDKDYQGPRDEEFFGKSLLFRDSPIPFQADLVLFMDVLEHVDNDVELLEIYRENIVSNASIVVTVPAFQFLFSAHDEFLGHKRRYTLKMLEKVIEQAGYEIVRSGYIFSLVFPLAALERLLVKIFPFRSKKEPKSSLRRHHFLVNYVLDFINKIEANFVRINKLPGLTVYCQARLPRSIGNS